MFDFELFIGGLRQLVSDISWSVGTLILQRKFVWLSPVKSDSSKIESRSFFIEGQQAVAMNRPKNRGKRHEKNMQRPTAAMLPRVGFLRSSKADC